MLLIRSITYFAVRSESYPVAANLGSWTFFNAQQDHAILPHRRNRKGSLGESVGIVNADRCWDLNLRFACVKRRRHRSANGTAGTMDRPSASLRKARVDTVKHSSKRLIQDRLPPQRVAGLGIHRYDCVPRVDQENRNRNAVDVALQGCAAILRGQGAGTSRAQTVTRAHGDCPATSGTIDRIATPSARYLHGTYHAALGQTYESDTKRSLDPANKRIITTNVRHVRHLSANIRQHRPTHLRHPYTLSWCAERGVSTGRHGWLRSPHTELIQTSPIRVFVLTSILWLYPLSKARATDPFQEWQPYRPASNRERRASRRCVMTYATSGTKLLAWSAHS